MGQKELLLQVKDLTVQFHSRRGTACAVNGISYGLSGGEVVGIVGESGSGKSTSAYAMLRLLRENCTVEGNIFFRGKDLLKLSAREMQAIRGVEIGMIFQDPMQCLDPMFTVGNQMEETLLAHRRISRREAQQISIEMLERVGIRNAKSVMKRYSFELSGGMCQRVMIAMALLLEPKLLIADEPTTALDVTIQDQILGLLKQACRSNDMAMIFITHNFGIVADVCEKVCVMYGGRIVEKGSVEEIFYACRHPYTVGLLQSIPKADPAIKERLLSISGAPVDVFHLPGGCAFHPRCAHCTERCKTQTPPEIEVAPGHTVACWLCDPRERVERDE